MPPQKKSKKEKRVAREATRQKVIVRAHRNLTRNKLVGYCQRWLRWSAKERADNLVLKDLGAIAANAYFEQIDDDEIKATIVAAKGVAARAAVGKTSAADARKGRERRRYSLAKKIHVTSAELTRPVDRRVVGQAGIWRDYVDDHPCSAMGQILAPILGAKYGILQAIKRNEQVVWVYMPMGPQTEGADVVWSWRAVVAFDFSPCQNFICVAPHPSSGRVGFGGAWRSCVGICLPFNSETPLVWILPKGYKHEDRAINYAARNQ